MEVLQRIQPLDILFAVLWAAVVGWGLQTGFIRQLGMLVGVYGGALLAGSIHRVVGDKLALAFGPGLLPILEFVAYVTMFVVVFGLVGVLFWRAYPMSRLSPTFGAENVLGAIVSAIWGVLFLIALLTILRYYVAVPWPAQEATQQSVLRQIQASQVAPVLQVVAAPLWQLMVPWFPQAVPPRL